MGGFLEVGSLIIRRWQALVIAGLFGLLGVVQAIRDSDDWVIWVIVALVALAVAAVLVARDALRERDDALKEAPAEVHEYHGPYYAGPVTIQAGGEVPASLGAPAPVPPPVRERDIQGTPDNYKVVYVWDLAEEVPGQPLSILNRTLRYVELRGPAVLGVMAGVTFDHVAFGVFEGDVETVIWTPGEASVKIGPFVIQHCVLDRCRTDGIGFTGPPEFLDELRRTLKKSQEGGSA